MFLLVEAAVVVLSLMLLQGGLGCKELSLLICPTLSDSISPDVTPPPFSDVSDENNSDENEVTAISDESNSSTDDTVARESFGVAELFRVGTPPCRRRPRLASFSDVIEETAMTDENDESSDDVVLREIFDTLEFGIESICWSSAAVLILLWLRLVSSALLLSEFLITVTACPSSCCGGGGGCCC